MNNEASELSYEGIPAPVPRYEQWGHEQQTLMRSVAHQLRSTLASVTIGAEALATVPGPPPQKVRHHAQVITEQAYHIGRLMDDLIALVSDQVEDGVVNVVELNEVIWEAAQQLWQLAKQRHIRLEILPRPELVAVHGKRSYLVQAVRGCIEYGLLNLPEGSRISTRIEPQTGADNATAVEILLEYLSSAAEKHAPCTSYALLWDQVTMRAVQRIIGAHKGDVSPLGNGSAGLRLLLPRARAAGAVKLAPPAPRAAAYPPQADHAAA